LTSCSWLTDIAGAFAFLRLQVPPNDPPEEPAVHLIVRRVTTVKRQYLGDSRDSFKWDYHHYLVCELGYSQLQVVWMMTADDESTHGRTLPELFPARPEIVTFCNRLRKSRDPKDLLNLPKITSARYNVYLFGSDEDFINRQRDAYFARCDLSAGVIFLDPDNGFEPAKSCSKKHVGYADVEALLKRIPPSGVISVFQHFRRKPFQEDFARIRERLRSGFATAVYWHALMFVAVTPSREISDRVLQVNRAYATDRSVKVLA